MGAGMGHRGLDMICIARDWIWIRGNVREDQELVYLLPWSEWHLDSRGSSCGVRVWDKAMSWGQEAEVSRL